MRADIKIGCLVFIASFLATAVRAEDTSVRTYPLPGHGVLQMAVPLSWMDEIRQPPYDLPPTISMRPREGNEFLVMITPLWNMSEDDFSSDAKLKSLVDMDRQAMAPSAVEEELELVALKGPNARGYYFIATDRAPKPGEWKYAMRAGVATGQLLLSVTVLTNDKESAVIADALEMIRSARHHR
ncbi:MAG: hypothetical protein C4520_04795 [Candidatus Abyssobacteria bacterium SURF_5]|uniref:DUF1795 domain-containing protein n=1 Tax=Abyssobacteria bacterium (strain SURF_5) TaxID=2093360 RepID=A0A3A4P129_ABYX5|nr:MAG: hypothetical protein C4520_04795 [Candidatus Abyssubacteria bacterium SURF_5]